MPREWGNGTISTSISDERHRILSKFSGHNNMDGTSAKTISHSSTHC